MGKPITGIVLIVVSCGGACVNPLSAQESRYTQSLEAPENEYPSDEPDYDNAEENTSINRDTQNPQITASPEDPEPEPLEKTPGREGDKANKNEDLVSFNFLYYIIQRYKMSDIVEK